MRILPSQHVKCIFRNGQAIEGIVQEWSDNLAVLQSLEGENLLIITDPKQDIMLIKIVLEGKSEELPPPETQTSPETPTNPFNDDYNKNLVELRKELSIQERRILTEKLREHRPTISAPEVKYEYPRFDTKPRTK